MLTFNFQRRPQTHPGWRVDNDSPITVSTAHRCITNAALSQVSQVRSWKEAETYTLFSVEVRPSNVLTYSVHKNGAALSRESQDIIDPEDYGISDTICKNIVFCTTTGQVTLTHRRPRTLPFLPSSSPIFGYGRKIAL